MPLKQRVLSDDLKSRGKLQKMYLSKSMQSILHSKHRAGVSQGRNTDQILPHFPQMSSVLAASGGGQRARDRESPVIPRGSLQSRLVVYLQGCSLNHIKSFLSSFSSGPQTSPQDAAPPQPPCFPSTAGPPGNGDQ